MCPKVKFKKDIEKEKEEIDNNSKKEESKKSNNISLSNTFLKTNKTNENNNAFNTNNNNNKPVSFFTPINNFNKKRLTQNNTNINQDEDLITSVKKIFLYNSKNKSGKESID